MCEILLTAFIVGATEVAPNRVQVEYLQLPPAERDYKVKTLTVPTGIYKECTQK
jgi:hypothetical protein